jgi:hypothetical protein
MIHRRQEKLKPKWTLTETAVLICVAASEESAAISIYLTLSERVRKPCAERIKLVLSLCIYYTTREPLKGFSQNLIPGRFKRNVSTYQFC